MKDPNTCVLAILLGAFSEWILRVGARRLDDEDGNEIMIARAFKPPDTNVSILCSRL